MTEIFLGIDPGKSGGLCFIDRYGTPHLDGMPETLKDLWEWFAYFRPTPVPFAILEKVQGYIGESDRIGPDGRKSFVLGGASIFKFGASYGHIQMALVASSIPFEEVTPQRWQRVMGIPTRKKSETKPDFKRRLKDFAQKLYPEVKMTLKTSDALLIAEYARRTHR